MKLPQRLGNFDLPFLESNEYVFQPLWMECNILITELSDASSKLLGKLLGKLSLGGLQLVLDLCREVPPSSLPLRICSAWQGGC